MVTQYGLQAMMNYGRIYVYSGTQPDSADKAPTGTLLGYVSQNGDAPVPGTATGGLIMAQSFDAGALEKHGTWRLKGIANGTAGWWRMVWNSADPLTDSDYYPRIDGAYGDSFLLPSSVIGPATDMEIGSFYLLLPSQ